MVIGSVHSSAEPKLIIRQTCVEAAHILWSAQDQIQIPAIWAQICHGFW
jgi:hypothetical protein